MNNNHFVAASNAASISNWQPTILLEDSYGCRPVPLLAKELTDRKIFITTSIDDEIATSVISQLLYLSSSNEDISIYISSPGGSVVAGLAIYDAIQALEGKVCIKMYGYGMVASMAAILLASSHKGHRYLMPNSKMLLHEPLLSNGVSGSCSNITQTAEKILETKKKLCNILAKHCNKPLKEIEKKIAGGVDVILDANESLKFGLIDEIRTPFDK